MPCLPTCKPLSPYTFANTHRSHCSMQRLTTGSARLLGKRRKSQFPAELRRQSALTLQHEHGHGFAPVDSRQLSPTGCNPTFVAGRFIDSVVPRASPVLFVFGRLIETSLLGQPPSSRSDSFVIVLSASVVSCNKQKPAVDL